LRKEPTARPKRAQIRINRANTYAYLVVIDKAVEGFSLRYARPS
jgi:hypothetical protein